MRLLLILPLIGVAIASPVVKRAKEVLIYGNQQNGPKVMKKSDPNMPALPDLQGDVRALDAQDIPHTENSEPSVTENKDDSKAIEKELLDQVMTEQEEADDNNEKEESNVKEETNTEDNSEVESLNSDNTEVDDSKVSEAGMAEMTPEQQASVEELEKAAQTTNTDSDEQSEGKDTPVDTAVDSNTEEGSFGNDWYQNPYDLYKGYPNSLYSNYPEELLNYYNLLGRKRRTAHKRLPGRYDIAVKRSRRIKRDLPDELLLNAPYLRESSYPYTPYADELSSSQYVYSPSDESNLEAYLELLEEANEADPRLVETEEYVPTFDLAKRVVYEGEPGYFVPVKRQALSYVPETKRDQFFYPFSEEPRTHYSAFVPDKRDYADTYESLLRLARTLGRRDRDDFGYEWQK